MGYWMHETSGVLKPVVEKYLRHEKLSPGDIVIMRAYLRQWIEADGFKDGEILRDTVRSITTQRELEDWLDDAMAVGIDPL